jgi:hypothetical protein
LASGIFCFNVSFAPLPLSQSFGGQAGKRSLHLFHVVTAYPHCGKRWVLYFLEYAEHPVEGFAGAPEEPVTDGEGGEVFATRAYAGKTFPVLFYGIEVW